MIPSYKKHASKEILNFIPEKLRQKLQDFKEASSSVVFKINLNKTELISPDESIQISVASNVIGRIHQYCFITQATSINQG